MQAQALNPLIAGARAGLCFFPEPERPGKSSIMRPDSPRKAAGVGHTYACRYLLQEVRALTTENSRFLGDLLDALKPVYCRQGACAWLTVLEHMHAIVVSQQASSCKLQADDATCLHVVTSSCSTQSALPVHDLASLPYWQLALRFAHIHIYNDEHCDDADMGLHAGA